MLQLAHVPVVPCPPLHMSQLKKKKKKKRVVRDFISYLLLRHPAEPLLLPNFLNRYASLDHLISVMCACILNHSGYPLIANCSIQ